MTGQRAHDPERDAALYVGGEMPSAERQRFEAHLLGCDDCWGAVAIGREGRAMAEASREVAPPGLRDDIRAAVSAVPERRSGGRRVVLVSAAVVLVSIAALAGATLRSHGEPPSIAAAIDSTRTQTLAAHGPAERSAVDLSTLGLRLVIGGRVDLGGLDADAFLYRTSDGEVVTLFVSDGSFPVARDATAHSIGGSGWSASDDGMTLVCGDRPANYLIVAEDPSLMGLVEHAFVSEAPTA